MSQYVTDTHPLLWHILSNTRLSTIVQGIFSDTDAGLHQILIPSIVLVETVYLVEKKRIDPTALDQLFSLLGMESANYIVTSLDTGVVQTLRMIDRAKVSDMPDRIIVATAKHLGMKLITKDATIAEADIVTAIW